MTEIKMHKTYNDSNNNNLRHVLTQITKICIFFLWCELQNLGLVCVKMFSVSLLFKSQCLLGLIPRISLVRIHLKSSVFDLSRVLADACFCTATYLLYYYGYPSLHYSTGYLTTPPHTGWMWHKAGLMWAYRARRLGQKYAHLQPI